MPSAPVPVVNTMEKIFGRAVAVAEADDLSPGLRRVVVAGDALVGRAWKPGQEVEFRVSATDMRHYTPRRMDPVAGTAELVLCTRHDGPGADWARRLAVGVTASLIGPAGRFVVRQAARHLVLGDATTLAAFAAIAGAAADGQASEVSGAVEVPAADVAAAQGLLPPAVDVLSEGSAPGAALHDWLDRMDGRSRVLSDVAYVAGHAQTVQALRRSLVAMGMARRQVRTHAFWATGRAGL